LEYRDIKINFRPSDLDGSLGHHQPEWKFDVETVRIPTVVVHPFRLNLYSDSDVVVHPGRS
jgi:hypothetical protein